MVLNIFVLDSQIHLQSPQPGQESTTALHSHSQKGETTVAQRRSLSSPRAESAWAVTGMMQNIKLDPVEHFAGSIKIKIETKIKIKIKIKLKLKIKLMQDKTRQGTSSQYQNSYLDLAV